MAVAATYRALWRISTQRERTGIVVSIILLLIGALLDTVGIGLVFVYLSLLVGSQNIGTALFRGLLLALGITDATQQAVAGGLLMLAGYVVKNIYLWACYWFLATISMNFFSKLIGGIYFHLLQMPYLSFAARKPAEISKIINNDSFLAFAGVVAPALFLCSDLFAFVFVSIALTVINPLASIAAFCVAGACAAVLLLTVRGLLNRVGKVRSQNVGHLIRWVNLTLCGYKEIRAYRKSEFFIQGFDQHFSRVLRADRIMRASEQLPRLLSETLLILAFIAVLLILIWLGVPVREQVPILAAFAIAGSRLVTSINRIMTSFQIMQFYGPSFVAVVGEYHASAADAAAGGVVRNSPVAEPGRMEQGIIRLDALSFRYPSSGMVLHDVSLAIPGGSTIGIVGRSGAGKSTLIDLLLGLLTPTEGRITAGGLDIGDNLAAWQKRIGYIPQHIYLLDDSIRANVAFGIPHEEVNDEAVWRALEIAQLKDFVSSLPDGLDSYVGDNGLSLSGGQRQRVSIARAFYCDPDVLLLDEATAALDNETERALTEALSRVAGQKTIIHVAHRLTSIQHCDCIYLLEKGRVLASGTYRELLVKSAEFRRMASAPADALTETAPMSDTFDLRNVG